MTVRRSYRFGRKVLLFCAAALVLPMAAMACPICNGPTGQEAEGILNHHILQIHHVHESRGLSAFDYDFAASGVILIIGGWMAIRSARSDGAQPPSS